MEKLDSKKIARFRDRLLDPHSWQRLLSRSWFLKGMSLCMAAMLWYFVGGKDTVDKIVMIPIEIINLPRDLVISNQFKKEIEVTVSGPSSLLAELANRTVTRRIDLSSAQPGTMVVDNTVGSIPVPRGIKVLRVQPSSLILSLDKLVQRHFPVVPTASGRVASGHVLKRLKMEPDVITITGPQTVLSQFDQLRTAEISVDRLSKSQQRQVPLRLDPAIVDLIGETSVTAHIEIGLETVKRKIKDMPVVAVLDGEQRQVKPAKVTITANIPKVMLKDNGSLRELFTVTATEITGDGKMKVVAIATEEAGADVAVVAVEPEVVSLVIEKSGAEGGDGQPPEKAVQPVKLEARGKG
jgi:YbbR domain-containing protein